MNRIIRAILYTFLLVSSSVAFAQNEVEDDFNPTDTMALMVTVPETSQAPPPIQYIVEGNDSVNAFRNVDLFRQSKYNQRYNTDLIQRPRVARQYEKKGFGSHMFLEMAASPLFTLSSDGKTGWSYNINIGDRVTPTHAWRVGLQYNGFMLRNKSASTVGAALDYLISINSVAQYDPIERESKRPRKFETFLVMGANLMYAFYGKEGSFSFGGHIGLRERMTLTNSSYIFVEPQLGLYKDRSFQSYNWHRYRPVGSMLFGFGYQMSNEERRNANKDWCTEKAFLSNTFFSVGGGPAIMLVDGQKGSVFKNSIGPRLAFSVGRMLTPSHALRLTAVAQTIKQNPERRERGFGAHLDYLLNFHSLLLGYKADRAFSLSAVLGGSYNYTASKYMQKSTPENFKDFESHESQWGGCFGIGGGLLGTIRLNKDVSVGLEPRVDVYQNTFAQPANDNKIFDVVPSLTASLIFYESCDMRARRESNKTLFSHNSWFDNLFMEASVSMVQPLSTFTFHKPFTVVRPGFQVGVGKWFTATSGVRVWGDYSGLEDPNDCKRWRTVALGLDFVWNISNTMRGYRSRTLRENVDVANRACRRFELWSTFGANLSMRTYTGLHPYWGLQGSVKAIVFPFSMLGIFVEPQARLYFDKQYNPYNRADHYDLLGAVNVGAQLRMNGYKPSEARQAWKGGTKRDIISFDGGLWVKAVHAAGWQNYYGAGRLAYTHRYHPVQGVRFAAGMQQRFYPVNEKGNPYKRSRYVRATAGVDYMLELTALNYGYEEDRPCNIYVYAGGNVGLSDQSGPGGARFTPDIHGGAQISYRFADQLGAHAEVQASYLFDKSQGLRPSRVQIQALLGVDWYLERTKDRVYHIDEFEQNKRHFVGGGLGGGVNTGNFELQCHVAHQIMKQMTVYYGSWFRGVQGWRAGVSYSHTYRHTQGNESQTLFFGDYMVALSTWLSGKMPEEQFFSVAAYAGVGLGITSKKELPPNLGAVVRGGLLGSFRVNDKVFITLEPGACLHPGFFHSGTHHKMDVQMQILLGCKYNF